MKIGMVGKVCWLVGEVKNVNKQSEKTVNHKRWGLRPSGCVNLKDTFFVIK